MSFETHRYINDVLVQEGAVITNPVSTTPILGRRIEVGAVCESLRPETWSAIVATRGARLWESAATHPSYDAAVRAARQHYDKSLEHALRRIFET